MQLVDGSCTNCHRDIGPVSWDADYVLCRRCAKAEDVYTPPRPEPVPDFSRELIGRLEAARRRQRG